MFIDINFRLISLLLFFHIPIILYGQHQGYIYGDIVLKNKKVYTGQISWGSGQRLWSDIFWVAKQELPNLKYLNEYQLDDLPQEPSESALDWQFMNLWKDKYPARKTEALCRFGDISRIHVTGKNIAQVYFKNGFKYRVIVDEDAPGNLAKELWVLGDKNSYKIPWDQISSINFKPTPNFLSLLKGNPLYGTMMTSAGTLSGYIEFGKNKSRDIRYLKGRTKEGENLQIMFKHIRRLEKRDNEMIVKLLSGKIITLAYIEDFTSGNENIVVMHPSFGKVTVKWKAFRSLSFEKIDENTGYEHYPTAKKIYGVALTKDKKIFKGNSVFDMDEEFDFELLEGSKDGISYQIPFRFISRIIPFNVYYSKVVLKNNKTLLLGHHNDVTARNWGMMVWQANSKFQYIPWGNLTELRIR